MYQPPGFIPGYHVPGYSGVPIGAIAGQAAASSHAATPQQIAAAAEHKKRFGQTYIRKTARQELKAAGVPTIEILWTYTEPVRKAFGRYKSEQRIHTMGTGWLLGSFEWQYNNGGNYGGVDYKRDELTVLVDRWQDPNFPLLSYSRRLPSASTIFSEFCGLYWVNRTENGYEVPYGSSSSIHLDSFYESVSAAIHKLAGT